MKQIKFKINKKAELGVLILFIFSVFALGLVLALSPITFKNVALALTNYSKNTGDSIGATDWNQLATDFLATDGTNSMNGNVITNVGTPLATDLSHAANVSFVMSQMQSGMVQDRDGNGLNMICDSTVAGATDWINYAPGGPHQGVYTVVDTRSSGGTANFSSAPNYFVSIGGISMHFDTSGGYAIYSPSDTGFTIYLKTAWTEAQAEVWQWTVNWCGAGL
ncbi:hypothetical protein KAJ89_05370 [Candidatus Parcubacteria bacterium]|nr:hypothetical protein [Candidatus Parcubacteria bacterium]